MPIKTEVLDLETTQVSEENKAKKSWRSYIWDSLDKSSEERLLVLKLDLTLLTLGCLGMSGNVSKTSPSGSLLTRRTVGYFTKYLDQANLTNAFVSGMYANSLVLTKRRILTNLK